MEIISRDTYINHIMRYVDKGMIIALTGQRRVGIPYQRLKTTTESPTSLSDRC